MQLFKSIVRGFGHTVGARGANSVMRSSSGIDGIWNVVWGFVKWCIIITFMIGFLQGLFS